MEVPTITDILSRETFRNVLDASPFADRAERIRNTLCEVHHQYLEQRLTGQPSGPEVDYSLLEEVAYYLSGVATTPRRNDSIAPPLRSQMLSLAALIFEYLGDTASNGGKTSVELEDSGVYYLDSCICNSLGLYEANTISLARKHLFQSSWLDDLLSSNDLTAGSKLAQNVLYAWLARDMPFLWAKRAKIEDLIARTSAFLNRGLLEANISRLSYSEAQYWLALANGALLHSRFFHFGNDTYLEGANGSFSQAAEQAKLVNNPPLLWIAYAIQKCAESMTANSVWKKLSRVCPARYLRRLVTSAPPVLELWTSQISALEAVGEDKESGKPIPLDHGFLDPRVHRVVVGMPTSSGKTLLAELAIVRTLFPDINVGRPVRDTTCIYVVPNLALANQIETKLLARLLPMGIRVTTIFGGYDAAQLDDTLLTQTRVAIVTPEKLDMLVRQDHTFVQKCGLFIFDEIHKVDNIGRGWTMETIITWLKDFHPVGKGAKMIFMSAVMPNYLQIQMWVQDQNPVDETIPALSVCGQWQPTRQIKGFFEIDRHDVVRTIDRSPLTEYWYGGHLNYVCDRSDLAQPRQIRRLIESKETVRRSVNRETLQPYIRRESKDSFGVEENAAEIAKCYVRANFDPVLVFFMSREQTRNFCEYLSVTEDYSPGQLPKREQEQYNLFIEYLNQRLGEGHPLVKFAAKGIGYHHGWLPRDVRAEIEYAFSRQWVRVLASTTTLIEGVNFPISTFILANYQQRIGKQTFWYLEKKDFQNMIGRAGRAVYDTEGQIVFMIPPDPSPLGVTWQDYLFIRSDDPERWILSSLNRRDFRRDVLKLILDAMEEPLTGLQGLSIDLDALDQRYGPGAREVGETVLRLQAFLLALTDKEVLEPDDIVTVRKFFERTLFGQQKTDETLFELVTSFAQKTGQLMVKAESDEHRRVTYGKVGLGFVSCQSLYQKARDFWMSYGQKMFDKEVNHLTTELVKDLGDSVLSLAETRPIPVKIPHTKPIQYLNLPHGDILSKWVALDPLLHIRDAYFEGIKDVGERAEAYSNYIRDAFEYKAPWVLSAFNTFISRVAQSESGLEEFDTSPLALQLSMFPAYAKFGVNNPAAAFFSMLGVNVRQMAVLLGFHYNEENPHRDFEFPLMLEWVLKLESEQVSEWFKQEIGEDTAGQVSRLFRFLDSLRGREQLIEDILPIELPIAGWQYYQGARALPLMVVGEGLTLKVDPLNPWDAYAVQVLDKRGTKLGFIPRAYSRAVYNHIISELHIRCIVVDIDVRSKFHPVTIRLDSSEA